MTEGTRLIRGLEGVVAAETKLCDLDGAHGRLAYGGYDIDDLARHATFEEVCYLLWHGELPSKSQIDGFTVALAAAPAIPCTPVTTKAFDASLTLYAEHELNASTFTTRVITSTNSDMHSAVAGGVGALKGPLHGGAGEAVMRTLMEIGEPANVDQFAARALAEKRRL